IDNYPEYEDINEIFFDQITRHYSINDDIFKLIVTNNHFFIKSKYIVQYSQFYYNYYKLSLISDKCKVHLKYLNEINAINANVYLLQILSQGARGDMEEYLYKIDDVLNYLIPLDVEIVKISGINSKYKNILLQEAEIIKKTYLVVIIKFLLKYKNYPEPKLYDYLYSQYLSEFLENSIPAKYYNKIRPLIERNTAVKYNISETDKATDAVESSNYEILDVGLSTNVLKDIYKYLKGESMSADIKEKLEKILTLKTIPMFESLDINNIMQISEITKYKDFDEKETVMREGESSDNFYIVVAGKVDVIRNNIKLNEVGPGSILGELGVIDDDVRTATIITKEKTTLLALDGKDFIDLLHKNATISYSVIKTLTSRLRGMIEMKTK
nr:cyclic nucleotide-binding domain-containing protein [Spirochaetota bacterium]